MTSDLTQVRWIRVGACVWVLLWAGCHSVQRVSSNRIENHVLGPMTIAVAPALNLSGSTDFDGQRFADIMAGELGHADGIVVIPVSRVLAALAMQGQAQVESPAHAMELARLVGADAILVLAVNDYDPYDPPRIGVSAQLYGRRPRIGGGGLDPVALSRRASLVSSSNKAFTPGLLIETQHVFDAACRDVADGVRAFAAARDTEDSPYGWRKYLVSQRHFIRYCCRATVRSILRGRGQTAAKVSGPQQVGMP